MSKPPEATRHPIFLKNIDPSILRALLFRPFHFDTPCIHNELLNIWFLECLIFQDSLTKKQQKQILKIILIIGSKIHKKLRLAAHKYINELV